MWDLEVRPVTVLVAVLLIAVGAIAAGRVTASGPAAFQRQVPMRVVACDQHAVAVSCLRPHGRP